MTSFLELSADDRRAILLKAAQELGRSEQILEKDFWVCWTLEQLFTLPAGLPQLTFKGGTSLSKVFNVIGRFSEDVDITVDRQALCGLSPADEDALSKTRFNKFASRTVPAAVRHLAEMRLIPELQERFGSLGFDVEADVRLDVSDETGQTILIGYPSVLDANANRPYALEHIRIELGARNPVEPSELHRVKPDIATILDTAGLTYPQPICQVLSLVRTFWEKGTILHDANFAPPEKAAGDRQARHWSDFSKLARHDVCDIALAQIEVLAAVAAHKERFFHRSFSRYDLAKPGTIRIVPSHKLIPFLKDDYQTMVNARFFYSTPPDFEAILEDLRLFEAKVNAL